MRNLIFLALIILAYTYIKKLFRTSGPSIREERKPEQIQDEMVQDPSCGVYVPKGSSVQKSISGREFYFCGNKCAEEYEKKEA